MNWECVRLGRGFRWSLRSRGGRGGLRCGGGLELEFFDDGLGGFDLGLLLVVRGNEFFEQVGEIAHFDVREAAGAVFGLEVLDCGFDQGELGLIGLVRALEGFEFGL